MFFFEGGHVLAPLKANQKDNHHFGGVPKKRHTHTCPESRLPAGCEREFKGNYPVRGSPIGQPDI